MRFEDVTERLGATVRYPGHKDDGKPFNVAMPHMSKVRIYQAVYGGYSWAITYEPGVDSWTDDEKKRFVGFTASYRKVGHNSSDKTIRIDGGPWNSMHAAEAACRRVWKQIRQPN